MQLIWRMQGKNGKGFYFADEPYDEDKYNSYSHHPMPNRDGLNECVEHGNHIFGFRTVTQARKWFRWQSDMRNFDNRFVLAAYDLNNCHNIHHGDRQTIFIPKEEVFASLLPSQLHGLCSRELHIRATKQLREQ